MLGIASENGLIRLKKCPKNLKDCTEVSDWCSERVKKMAILKTEFVSCRGVRIRRCFVSRIRRTIEGRENYSHQNAR